MTSITLYDYWRSSASYRVRIALNLAGIPFKAVPIDLQADEQSSDQFRTINPQGLVPVIEIDGHHLTQSLAIIEYLHETGRYKFLPEDPKSKVRVRQLSYAVAMEIHPVCNISVAAYANNASKETITMSQWMHAFIPKGLGALENMLNSSDTGTYCHGNTLTMSDICLVPQLYNANRWGVSLDAFPIIRRISEELEQIPEFSAAHPDLFHKD